MEEEERRQTDRQTSGPDRDYVMWPRYSLIARTRLFAPTANNYSCAGAGDDGGRGACWAVGKSGQAVVQ